MPLPSRSINPLARMVAILAIVFTTAAAAMGASPVAASTTTDSASDEGSCPPIAIDEAENRLHVQKAIMAALIGQR